ncbi:MAG: peptidylprolyl isomerase [Acidimicrobiales bacterium]|jgi:hypothetical protein
MGETGCPDEAGCPDDEAVTGWVHGVAVPTAALVPYLAQLAAGPAGTRLGVTDEPGALTGPAHSKADSLRTWGAKALLVDVLLRAEAARLGVADATSPSDWMTQLESAGELPDQAPTEADMQAYYAANCRRFAVSEARRVRHVLVADQRSAERVLETAPDAAALARLAAESSLDEGSRDRGGDLGWVGRGQLAGTLEEAIFAAEPNQVIGPVPSPFGWHVLAVDAIRPGRDRSFAECRSEVGAELAEYRRRRAWLDWLDRRVAEAISVPAGAEHPLFRGLPGSTHRH